MYSAKNIRGGSNVQFNITNDDINASWLTVTADTVTANNTLYVNTMDVEASINLKQDIIDGSTDITMNDLTSNSITNATSIDTDTLTASGDIICNTLDGNVEAVDLTVSKYCNILGPRNATEANAGCYIGHILTDDFGLNLVSNATGGSVINFTKPNTAHIGSIDFDNTNEVMGFVINAVSQLTLDGTTADFQSNAITTAGTVQGDYMTCIQTLTTNDLDVNNNLVVTGDLTVDTTTLHVDSTNNRVGIGTTTPESTLQIVGARQGVPTTVGVHIGHSSGTNYGLELCSLSNASSGIDFTQPNTNRKGSIGYDNTTNIFTISTNDSQTQLTIQDGLLDAQDCDITTTGDITCQDLTVNGSFSSTQSLQDIYNNNDVEPHIIINQSHPVTFQGHASVTNTFQCRNPGGSNVFEVSKDGDVTTTGDIYCDDMTTSRMICNGVCSATGSMYTTGNLGAGKINPTKPLDVNGDSYLTGNMINLGSGTFGGLSVDGNASVSSLLSCDNFKCNGTLGTVDIGIFAGMDGDVPNLRLSGDSNKDASISLDVSGTKMFTIYHDALNSYTHFYVVGTTYDVMKFNYQGVHMPLNCHITGYLNCFGNLNCTSTMRVNTTTNMVKIGGTTEPTSSLHVIGPRQTTPSSKGIHLGYGASSDEYGMEICSAVNNNSVLDFTEEGSDYRGRILYNPSLERFDFSANGALQFVLSSNEANFQNQLIKTTGDLAINTDTLYVDSTNNRVGIGTTTLESGFQIRNVAVLDAPTVDGLSLGMHNTLNPCVQLCALNNNFSFIDFTTANDIYEARIVHYNSSNTLSFWVNSSRPLDLNETSATFGTDLIITGDLTVDTNTLHVDSANNRVGIGTTTPESALQVVGARQGVPTTVGVHIGHSSGTNYGLEICSLSTAGSGIDFTQPNTNRRGSIGYDNSTNIFTISTNNSQTQLTIQDGTINAQDNNITTTGNIDANLNSTRGQLITYHGEESGQLNVGAYDFNYGNGATSDANFAPMMPCSVKLKKFTYIGGGGSNPTTSTKYVFRAYIDGIASSIYAYVDFSNTTNGNITRHKFCNKFSSSATSQIDLTDAQATLTDSGAGIQISWQTFSKSSGSTDNKHRFGWIVETIEDLN